MCLIMYSPEGQLPPRDVWLAAQSDNPDGIGVMSERAIVKWTGQTGYAKAWKHVNKLNAAGVPFSVHFRWRTHGEHSKAQCHPHATPFGSYVMHNGVLGPTSSYATAEQSDTAIYVEWYLSQIRDWSIVRPLVEGHIGDGNKFVIMDEYKEFHIFNEHVGVRHNGIWYSNDYSFDYGYAEELEAQNDGYAMYTGASNFGLGHSYATPAKSAKASAKAFDKRGTVRKPTYAASSEEWTEYYNDLYETGGEPALLAYWEAEDQLDRDDYDNYEDRMVRDIIR